VKIAIGMVGTACSQSLSVFIRICTCVFPIFTGQPIAFHIQIQAPPIRRQPIAPCEFRGGFSCFDKKTGIFLVEPLPAKKINASLITLRKSLKILEEQNLLTQRKGLGTFITYQSTAKIRIAISGIELNNDVPEWANPLNL
jgi:hypothetical protein